jgi:hypothetical protein
VARVCYRDTGRQARVVVAQIAAALRTCRGLEPAQARARKVEEVLRRFLRRGGLVPAAGVR